MIRLLFALYAEFRNLILYGIIGSLTAGLDFGIFLLLSDILEWHYIVANCASVIAGISASFILNRSLNFKVKDKLILRFATFVSIGLSGMLVSNTILWICIDCIGLNDLLSKLASIIIVVIFQFLLNKHVTFKY